MASTTLTGSYSGANAGNYAIRCVCSSTSNGSTANTSNVTVQLQMRRAVNTGYEGQWSADGSAKGRIIINGSDSGTASVTFDTRTSTSWQTIKTYTVNNIAHNADGSKSITIKAYFEPNATSTLYGGYVSGTFVLDTIPRATTPTLSATSVTMGSAVTITIKPASSGFKHKVRYSFGSLTGQTSGLSVGANFTAAGDVTVTFTPPTTLGSQIPSANSGTCTVYCYTYNSSGTQIGNATTKTLTLNIPSYTPSGSITISGNNLRGTAYVQGKSTVTGNITFSTSYGATIKSVVSTVDGKSYTSSPFTSSVLSAGSKTVSVVITDSRNKTKTVTSSSFTVQAYANPYITTFKVERQSDGTTVIATLVGGVSSINSQNTKTFAVTLNGVTQTITSTTYTVNGTTTFTNIPTDTTLTATAKISDAYTSVSKVATLPTVEVTLDFLADGKGVAFGKVAETTDTLEVAWKTKLNKAVSVEVPAFESFMIKRTGSGNAATIRFANENGKLGYIGMTNYANEGLVRWTQDSSSNYLFLDTGNTKDYIVERGTSGIWTYRKWNSGVAECWGVHTMTSACTKAWGSLFYSDSLCPRISYPFTFTSRPQETVFCRGDSVSAWAYPEGGGIGMNTTTQTGQYGFLRPTTMTAAQVRYEFTVIGKWK